MDKDAFVKRTVEVLAEESVQPEEWYYLSFAGEKFNGGCIVRARGLLSAVSECNRLKINPHGEVVGAPIPDEHLPAEKYRNRLLTKEDIQEFWPDAKSAREWDEEENEVHEP